MDVFPAFIPLRGRRIVVAGTGEAAEAKARLFAGSPAEVVRLDAAAAVPESYAGASLVFIVEADAERAQAAAAAARQAGALVNVVDRPELCDFTTPSVIDRGEVVAAVGTGGASPMLAALLRGDIEQRLPAGTGRVAALLAQLQDEVRAALPVLHERRAFLRAALEGPAAQAALVGDMEAARRMLREALAAGVPAQGGVWFVVLAGPADLLSLRAARALAAADILVADLQTDPAVLALARRDAERLAPDVCDLARLIGLARAGLRAVVAAAAPVASADLAALTGAGVRVEVLLAAPAS